MHWKVKARIQSLIAKLPANLSYKAYYFIQRKFGNLGNPDPMFWLTFAADSVALIHKQGKTTDDAVFFEVGTGRSVMFPVVWWLSGAKKIITVDLNPYLTADVNTRLVSGLVSHSREVEQLLGSHLKPERLHALQHLMQQNPGLDDVLNLCQIEYKAPSDAASTGLPDRSIDIHCSFTVLEHIPPDILRSVMKEGRRILRKEGLFVHNVDYSDHFSHGDASISTINFLQYDEASWDRLAGNRFMYMNRLRHDDYLSLYDELGLKVEDITVFEDPDVEQVLKNPDFRVNERFASKSAEILKIRSAWQVLSP